MGLRKVSIFMLCFLGLAVSAAFGAYHHAGDAEKDARVFLERYPERRGTKLDSCALCHSGGTATAGARETKLGSCQWCHYRYGYQAPHGDIGATLNAFGKEYLAQGRNVEALQRIEKLDSDRDGWSNLAEIQATRFPGDAADDPGKAVAPYRIFGKKELEALPQHRQLMLMNTTKSGDYYAEYAGVPVAQLLKRAGISGAATAITVFAPDGFAQEHPLEDSAANSGASYRPFVNGSYPQALYYYDREADKALGKDGWCDYRSSAAAGRKSGAPILVSGGLRLLLALQVDGRDLIPGKLGKNNKLQPYTDGPFHLVTPQKQPGPPDQASNAKNQRVVWPYDPAADHNAGHSTKCATLVKVEPLPEGTTDLDVLEAGWNYLDQEQLVVYGALQQLSLDYPGAGEGAVPVDGTGLATLRWKGLTGADAAGSRYAVELRELPGGAWRRIAGELSGQTSLSVPVKRGAHYSWRVLADGPSFHNVSETRSFTTAR